MGYKDVVFEAVEELIDMENVNVVWALFILSGLILDGKPSHVVKNVKNWRKNERITKRELFDLICSIIGAIFIILGALLALGVIK